jgi:hypothetical protein
MKRVLVILSLMVVLPLLQLQAQDLPNQNQNQNPDLNQLNAYKIAFFTRRLNLTSQEAEKFWPVYNEFQTRRLTIQTERQKLNRNINQNMLNMSEKEMIETGDKLISLQTQEASLAQEYHKKFREILSPAKILRLYQAENQYRLQLLNELEKRQPLRNNQPQKEPGRRLQKMQVGQ